MPDKSSDLVARLQSIPDPPRLGQNLKHLLHDILIQPLSSNLFEFTYLDDAEAVKMRFRQWLEDCLVSGLEYWRKEL
jgi:hypothetical protein